MASFATEFLVVSTFSLLIAIASAGVVERTFHIGNKRVRRLGKERSVVVVNGQLPGPSIIAHEGDTLIIHVINQSPYNMTIHWHGIFQRLSEWSDGPAYVTQCPMRPGYNFTYKYKVAEQEGTLWYHAHVSFLRATVYGALIIYPRRGRSHGYPFPKPHREIPILLGEWWDANLVEVEAAALASGGRPVHADAFTINGKPGHLYPFSCKDVYRTRKVVRGKRYLLRIVNAALNAQFFFKIAGHNMTVVAADASYTRQHTTDTIVIAPGQTIDALLLADAAPSTYYLAASHYFSAHGLPVPNTPPAIAFLRYRHTNAATHKVTNCGIIPPMPEPTDSGAAHLFYNALTSLTTTPQVPVDVDVRMMVTLGFGLMLCGEGQSCGQPFEGWQVVGSMNNVSLRLPVQVSLLEAHYRGIDGVFTEDFPNRPPVEFDYVGVGSVEEGLCRTTKGTRLKRLRYGARVEVVLQDTAIVGVENHPIHLHGYNFFVVAQGFGNYDEAGASLNLVDPHVRNTVAVPAGGWAVIRFVADNPGVWIMHCHLDLHLPLGLATVFVVEDGPTISSTLPPPPPNFPPC